MGHRFVRIAPKSRSGDVDEMRHDGSSVVSLHPNGTSVGSATTVTGTPPAADLVYLADLDWVSKASVGPARRLGTASSEPCGSGLEARRRRNVIRNAVALLLVPCPPECNAVSTRIVLGVDLRAKVRRYYVP